MDKAHTVIVDWDGMRCPGDVAENDPTRSCLGSSRQCTVCVARDTASACFSARLNPYDPFTGELMDESLWQEEVDAMRARSWDAQPVLSFIDIHTTMGEAPPAVCNIDDKAER